MIAVPLEGFEIPRVYRPALWARALLILAASLALAFGGWFLVVVIGSSNPDPEKPLLVLVSVLTGLGLLAGYLLASALRARVVLSADAIEVRGALTGRRLARADISGRRLLQTGHGQSMTQIIPCGAGMKPLKFSRRALNTDSSFDTWLGSLPDLDAQETAASTEKIATNTEFGLTPEERLARLDSAKKVGKALIALTWATIAWGFAYPKPYAAAMLAQVLLPWLAIGLVATSAGLYRITPAGNDVRPSVWAAISMPGFVLAIRAWQDVGILDWQRAGIFAAVIAVTISLAALKSDVTLRARSSMVFVLFACACGYGFGAAALGNSLLDSAPGNRYEATVLDMHVIRGSRSTTYHLTLAPWGPRTHAQEVTVKPAVYAAAQPGRPVCVHQGPGALGISWYTISPCG
jgi:hypothetical protein